MLTNLPAYLANAKKAIIQIVTLVITIGTLILTFQSSLPDGYAALITTVVAVAGSVLHYVNGNAPAPGTVEAVDDGDDVPEASKLVDANGDDVPNEEPEDDELDEGPVVSEPPIVVTKGKHELVEDSTT